MNRIITAVSLAALMGAATATSLWAGGPPDDGYPTQMQSGQSQAAPQAAPTDNAASDRTMQDQGGTDAMAANSSAGTPAPDEETFHGLRIVREYPDYSIDSDGVQLGHIGAEPSSSEGTLVAEILGAGPSVAEVPSTEGGE